MDSTWLVFCVSNKKSYNAGCMPTVLRSGPYRFYFYSHEPNEAPHVHVDRDDLSAKFWLEPVALARNFGFNVRELTRLEEIVSLNRAALVEAWHGHFGAGRG
jgi:hypothetical protein